MQTKPSITLEEMKLSCQMRDEKFGSFATNLQTQRRLWATQDQGVFYGEDITEDFKPSKIDEKYGPFVSTTTMRHRWPASVESGALNRLESWAARTWYDGLD